MRWLHALILGIVQGVTEFLPISSDGHLTLAEKILEHYSGVKQDGGANLFFFVMLHLGTLAAIVVHYRRTAIAGARGLLLNATEVDPDLRRSPVIKAGLLACLATLPAVPVGLFLKKEVEAAFESLPGDGRRFPRDRVRDRPDLADQAGAQGARRDQVAACPPDRDRPDDRDPAGREPERHDDHHGARAWADPLVGGRIQPADGRAGDPGGDRPGVAEGRLVHLDPRLSRADGAGHPRRLPGRIPGDRLVGPDREGGAHVVLFRILDRTGGGGADLGRSERRRGGWRPNGG